LSAITEPGFLQWLGAVTNCVTSGSVWFTNMSATVVTNGTMNFSFTIQGGSDGAFYDVFATATLTGSGYGWAWMGQGYHCNTYMLTNLPISSAFFILGTAQDSDFDGLTDAYEKLVSHSDPFTPNTSGDGLSDLYKVLHGLPVSSMAAVPSLGSITLPCCPIP
jgi:hypothetical protein